jgi:cellobiose-specific phosphotransferase system component IIA
MNKNDRKELEKALALLGEAQEIIDAIKDGEQEKFDNLSEGLQQAEKGQKFEEAVSTLEDAWNSIDEAVGSINEAME